MPGNDAELAAETVRELNRRFALGDLSWFEESTHRSRRRRSARAPTLADWSQRWLERARGEIGEHTWRTYRTEANDLERRFGDRRLDQITVADLIDLRRDLKRLERSERTIRNRLAFLRLLIRDARPTGLVDANPFDVPLPRGRTKHDLQQHQTKRVTFRPLPAAELDRVLEVLRSPRDAMERMWFPLTELLLLTGLRWGEGAGLRWPDVSERDGLVHVQRTIARGGRVEPTMTGASWTIPARSPLADLLRRQRAISYVGRTDSWIFPNHAGGPLDYQNWRHRGWKRVLERSQVSPREGDAQNALRRSYITGALVCGRNPKLVAAELGHATSHMVVSNYDSFLDPRTWPEAEEIEKLRAIYGWKAVEDRFTMAPHGHPPGASDRDA
jgi:integrase